MTEEHTETGPFDRPDPIVKRELLVEEHDENTRLQSVIKKQAIGNVAIGIVAIGLMVLTGYKYTQEDVRYMMYERDAQNKEIFWMVDPEYAPTAAAIHAEAQALIWNLRRTAKSDNDIYINLDMRARALERIDAPGSVKDQWLAAEERNLMKNDEMVVLVSDIRTKEVISPGKMVTVEWTETIINTNSRSQKKVDLTADLKPTIGKPNKDNPSGVTFNLPTVCIVGGECL